jgi:predicted transcriptional regulator
MEKGKMKEQIWGIGRVRKIGFENKEEKKEKNKETIFESFNKDTAKPLGSKNSKRSCKGNSQKNFPEITEYEGEVLENLASTFNAGLSNSLRIKMLEYCLTERSFSNIMLTLRLNPASLKHHVDLLQESGLIEKTGKGTDTRYKTTHLGKTLLSFVRDVLKVVRVV